MKIRISKKQGTVLLVTLVITAIFGTALASYMQLVQYQNRAVARSQQWNGAIPLSEAGIEEALAQLNKVGNDNRATNGWIVKDGQYYMARTLDSGRYEVYVNTNWQPTVSATGYIIDPMTQKEISRFFGSRCHVRMSCRACRGGHIITGRLWRGRHAGESTVECGAG